MSNFNYMDDVPVKISESYKPLPKVFQTPQAIVHKLQQPAEYYHESPHYAYDFQLEHKVLAKIPEWRRMRQQERDVRRERKQRREEQRIRAVEQQHKQMLGAVSYPDAEELSSTDSDTEEEEKQEVEIKQLMARVALSPVVLATNGPRLATTEAGSFHNILQPTILPQLSSEASNILRHHVRNKSSGSFNYRDFEEDTSSPFDNIELKSINDLDILAQVLQNTLVKASDNTGQQECGEIAVSVTLENKKESNDDALEEYKPQENHANESVGTLEHVKAALERVDYGIESQQNHTTSHIPVNNVENKQVYAAASANNYIYANPHHSQVASTQSFATYAGNQQELAPYMHYNPQQQHLEQHQYNTNYNQHHLSYVANHNYLYSAAPACNGSSGGSYYSPSPPPSATTQHYIGHNANTYLAPAQVGTANNYFSPQILSTTNTLLENDLKCKSKSVPDILQELSEEVRNSEMRRSRNYSCNTQEANKEEAAKVVANHVQTNCDNTLQPTPIKTLGPYYIMLAASTQKLAKNISSMGFPLERVSKIAQMLGADDKKIIEHLIPLSELIDLGFEESKISEALIRFDNNKEKALEYLIS